MDNIDTINEEATQTGVLSEDEERFCNEYMIDFIPESAYMRAFPECGLSGKKLRVAAKEILNRAQVRAEVEIRKEDLHNSYIMSAQEILETLTKIARGEVLDQFGLDASLKDRQDALKELAKRKIDIPAELIKADSQVTIKIVR